MRFFFVQSLHICAKCSIFAADFVILLHLYALKCDFKGFLCIDLCDLNYETA